MELETRREWQGHCGFRLVQASREENPTSSVVGLCVNGEVPSNGALGRLIWPAG
jgi:hypothetical protein